MPLGLAAATQFGLALFEGTFALFAQERLQYGPAQVGAAFVVCGVVMAVFQVPAAALLGGQWSAYTQVWCGLTLMALGSVLLLVFSATPLILASIAVLALGAAIVSPNLAALVSRRGGIHTGAALGAQGAANSLGQFAGPALGGVLFAWQTAAPYVFGGVFLFCTALLAAAQSRRPLSEYGDAD
jgi:DHA1 family multidrug resistance protein-like MFS transporter